MEVFRTAVGHVCGQQRKKQVSGKRLRRVKVTVVIRGRDGEPMQYTEVYTTSKLCLFLLT